jgi:cysteinyl-tRNA synthetase
MLKLFNTLGRKLEPFTQRNTEEVTIFTCGPSVYQKSHIGNFRTFLFEDILVRYLEYLGYTVQRGMNFTDVEDKAIAEAKGHHIGLKPLTKKNIEIFLKEMKLLSLKIPDFLPRASESVEEAVQIIEHLLNRHVAYWYRGNVYFDPLLFPGFGKLFGLDMTHWPKKKIRFHKDTYPGIRWNLGDFILWHGYKQGDAVYWDTRIGRGRPSWNIQDPSMIVRYFHETLSFFCGGIDNLYRHHDYNLAILESLRHHPLYKFRPMARFWLHCHHLHINGQKMSKSKGNIHYIENLQSLGYTPAEIRFFLVYGHYRHTLNYSERLIRQAAEKLRLFKRTVKAIEKKLPRNQRTYGPASQAIKNLFRKHMDNDLDVRQAFDQIYNAVMRMDPSNTGAGDAAAIIAALQEIDQVLQVIF